MTGPTVVVDARWIDRGGPGRMTRNVLAGLVEAAPTGEWSIVGPKSVLESVVGDAFAISDAATPSSTLAGLERPFGAADVIVHLHHLRPLRRTAAPCVGMVYDTIPIRHARRASARVVARRYLRRVAAVSDRILTISNYSRRCIEDDLGVQESRIDVLPFCLDEAVVGKLRQARGVGGVEPGFVFVGRSAPHKNIDRLVRAHLLADVGVPLYLCTAGEPVDIPHGAAKSVIVVPRITDDELAERFFSSAIAIVQPSYEEGLGLPVLEAAAAGIPVVAADIPALREVGPPAARWFDPYVTDSIVAALRAASSDQAAPDPAPVDFPGPRALAEVVIGAVGRVLSDR